MISMHLLFLSIFLTSALGLFGLRQELDGTSDFRLNLDTLKGELAERQSELGQVKQALVRERQTRSIMLQKCDQEVLKLQEGHQEQQAQAVDKRQRLMEKQAQGHRQTIEKVKLQNAAEILLAKICLQDTEPIKEALIPPDDPSSRPESVAPASTAGDQPKDCMLTLVDRVALVDLVRFVASFREHSTAHLALLMHSSTCALAEWKGSCDGVNAIASKYRAEVYMVESNSWHAVQGRFVEFRDWLDKHNGFRNVGITDARDVVFQKDPFAIVKDPQGMYVFLDAGTVQSQSYVNTWTDDCYLQFSGFDQQAHEYEAVKLSPLSCAGFSIGSQTALKAYFHGMVYEMERCNRTKIFGPDQATHQWLIGSENITHYFRDKSVNLHTVPMETSPVYAANHMPGDPKRDAAGFILNDLGVPYAVVHLNGDASKKLRLEKPFNERSPEMHS